MNDWEIVNAHALEGLAALDADSVQVCVTSPPYWGLRDYKVDGQLGLEKTPEAFTEALVEVLMGVHRVLRPDGTLWLNLGDSFAGASGGYQGKNGQCADRAAAIHQARIAVSKRAPHLKSKDLVGIPWMVAFALRAAGWWLRQDVIWHKPNPMPENILDRPHSAHEHLFLLSKSATYYYDAEAVRTPLATTSHAIYGSRDERTVGPSDSDVKGQRFKRQDVRAPRVDGDGKPVGAHLRSVWTIGSQPFSGAHFAVFPPRLVEPCILAGSKPGDLVLDPFAGAGTTGLVALRLGRRFLGIELNPEFASMARARIQADAPLLNAAFEMS